MLVLGIDPGTANTGYGVVRGGGNTTPSLVECGVIRTRARDPLPARLREIFEGIQKLIERHKPRPGITAETFRFWSAASGRA